MKLSNFFLLCCIPLSLFATEARTIKVAAVQMQLEFGNVEANLEKTERFIRNAFELGAELVVLPEYFPSPAVTQAYDTRIIETIRPFKGEPMELLVRLAKEFNGIIGGSYLALHEDEVLNSFVLVFPDGEYFVHNKDFPTFFENCFMALGKDDGVFETPIGRIGVVLCYEFMRTGTANRMLDRVDLILGASCWPNDPNSDTPRTLEEISYFAKLIGVPVVHSNHIGDYQIDDKRNPGKMRSRHYVGQSQIIHGNGKVSQRLTYKDGEGILIEEIKIGEAAEPAIPIPDRFWIHENQKYKAAWEKALTGPYREFYNTETVPNALKKWSGDE
jgi:predicted amidohydrolase